jgi:uncharacterized protein (DUF433 family)
MNRITTDVRVRWGQPCLRDTGISVAHVVSLQRDGLDNDEILESCPELTADDLDAAFWWHREYCDWGLLPMPPEPLPRHTRIGIDPEIQGGYPVIAGTRVTVDAIVGMWEDGFTADEILDEFPGLTADDIDEAVDYDLYARKDPDEPVAHNGGSRS